VDLVTLDSPTGQARESPVLEALTRAPQVNQKP